MEGYLRLGLLLVATLIILFILLEAWFRRRRAKMAHLSMLIDETSAMTSPDEVLGLHQESPTQEPHFAAFDEREPMLDGDIEGLREGHPLLSADSEADDIEPILNDIEFNKLLYSFEKEAEAVVNNASPIVKGEPVLSSRDVDLATHTMTETKAAQAPSANDHFLMMSVLAKPGDHFASYDLLQAITATGMQFGDMNIFHYYATTSTGRVTLFSLVSATEPGEFDIDRIGEFSCIGLTLFMDLRAVPDPQYAFELMHKTAEQLADDLNAELCAGHSTLWTDAVFEQYQRKVDRYQAMQQLL